MRLNKLILPVSLAALVLLTTGCQKKEAPNVDQEDYLTKNEDVIPDPNLVNKDYYALKENSEEFNEAIKEFDKEQGAYEVLLNEGTVRYVYLTTGPITDKQFYFVTEPIEEVGEKLVLKYALIATELSEEEQQQENQPYGMVIHVENLDKPLELVQIEFSGSSPEEGNEQENIEGNLN